MRLCSAAKRSHCAEVTLARLTSPLRIEEFCLCGELRHNTPMRNLKIDCRVLGGAIGTPSDIAKVS